MQYPTASQPFHFYSRVNLQELTGWKATNLEQLLAHLKRASDAVVYHHTHHFLLQHQFDSPEPPNDFAYWVLMHLNEPRLGEKLASINIVEYRELEALRNALVKTIEDFLKENKGYNRKVSGGQEFHFLKCRSFVFQTPYSGNNIQEFAFILSEISIDSIYFHMFEARLRLKKGKNDFSLWFETALGENDLADKISRLDPYTHTMDGLRKKILSLIQARMKHLGEA